MRKLISAASAAAMILILGAACANTDAIRHNDLQVAEIQTRPDLYIDKDVTVEAPVKTILSSRTFLIGEGDTTMLVLLNPHQLEIATPVAMGKLVNVEGHVEMVTDLHDAIWTGIDLDAHRSYVNQPVLVADRVFDAD
jgi:hypothetical protein